MEFRGEKGQTVHRVSASRRVVAACIKVRPEKQLHIQARSPALGPPCVPPLPPPPHRVLGHEVLDGVLVHAQRVHKVLRVPPHPQLEGAALLASRGHQVATEQVHEGRLQGGG